MLINTGQQSYATTKKLLTTADDFNHDKFEIC